MTEREMEIEKSRVSGWTKNEKKQKKPSVEMPNDILHKTFDTKPAQSAYTGFLHVRNPPQP